MKSLFFFACVLVLTGSTFAQQSDSAAMQNWIKYMTPGKEHKMMASWDGAWTGDISMWMAPGATPSKSKGTMENKMVLDGRYQQATYTGSFDGMPFSGMSTLAFDNARKVFISTWIDNMGTGIMVGEGKWNEAKKAITFRGKMVDPTTGKEVAFREVLTITGPDTQTMEMFNTDAKGKEYRSMEIKYTRN